jgi:hypothetical protein
MHPSVREYVDGVWLVRLVFERSLACIYVVAFLGALLEGPALLGDRGLTPIARFLRRANFLEAPSLFFLFAPRRIASRDLIDVAIRIAAAAGIILSIAILVGVTDRIGVLASALVWLALWFLYLSFVNVGQRFYAFGWESMLAEAGFFAAFLGPSTSAPSVIPIFVLRWMLFRTELGAGLIKVRHDQCWRDFTCLRFHYETQPLPNPLSVYFHRLPKSIHHFSVFFSHLVQLAAPFALFAPQPVASVAGAFIIVHQLLLIVSGNYSWLNWLTIVLAVTALDDTVLHALIPIATPAHLVARTALHQSVLDGLAGVVVALSVRPVLNFFARRQLMNFSYNPLHLVNAYGAFGTITRVRYEIILEGTHATDPDVAGDDQWLAYEFKAKPGALNRRPAIVAPYHLRLDWLMWFLPFSTTVTKSGVAVDGYDEWFLALVEHLLDGDARTAKLLAHNGNPFESNAPRFIRARMFRYRFTNHHERKQSGHFWHRRAVGDYLPPVSKAMLQRAQGAADVEGAYA